ncbi:oxidoreductase [Legionella sainthelensi]|uniref:FAD-binding oxidoreductase n=1 Tax=Legionella sainthelensi TaxID=28087 RepID=UPI000E2089B6|nr:FAD-binding oxidoreductase [Legionella sainthelensi]VEB34796.1 oxidoreductase [Legionella sainthelensi]
MNSKKQILSNFSCAKSQSFCLRPDNEEDLTHYIAHNPQQNLLMRGSGLSYNDSCFNTNGYVIDSERLNHLIDFDPQTGIVICQGGVPLKDLFLLNPDFIPPVIPGTVHATVAGGIAHDIHGKNNHKAGSFGHHLISFDLLIGNKKIHCNRNENTDLFHATIAGLGLTGVITRARLRLKKASRFILAKHIPCQSLNELTELMLTHGINDDYQVAWIDLLNSKPCAILSIANHCEPLNIKQYKPYSIPKIPFSLIRPWNMKLFNRYFFNSKKTEEKLTLEQFNNPLDKIKHWNRLYGPQGLIQFQAVFDTVNVITILDHLIQIIRTSNATPTLAVLKLFNRSGDGLLSFCKPGFTLAIDFIHNSAAKQAISSMNQLIIELNGRIYLAKDSLVNEEQYKKMYENHAQFSEILKQHACTMRSDLATRLGITK